MRTFLHTAWVVMAAAALAGCASFSADGGFTPVQRTAEERLGKQLVWARSDADLDRIAQRVAQLLQQPLGVDEAVQIALLNNRGLQAQFQELGITEAEMVQASRPPNPGFSVGRSVSGDERERELGLHINLARLLMLPMIQRLEARRFERTQGEVTQAMLSLAAQARKAYYEAVTAQETVRYMEQVKQAADASAELARRMARVGNFNKLQQAREQGFYAEAALKLAQAQQAQHASRERLARLMGVWGEQVAFTLPQRLPDLPKAPLDLPQVEQVAMSQRLDVLGAKRAAEDTASNLGLTRTTRFINVLELEGHRSSSNEGHRARGWDLKLELPLFDWGGARVARAEALYMQAVHRAAEAAINARSEVREAYLAYRSAYDMARHHRDELVPLSKLVAEENLLRYNGMFIGVFELLADARAQIATVNAAIEAQRNFWIAHADLDMALIGKPTLTPAAGPSMAPSAGAGGGGH
jgi:outer membrane protein TolC